MIRTEDFDYHLPESLIAQQPAQPRDSCRLLIVPRNEGPFTHSVFSDLLRYLHHGDRLVFNDTQVIPARIYCKKATGGKFEVFFLEQTDPSTWKALIKPGRRAPIDTRLHVEADESVVFKVTGVLPEGERLIRVDPESGSDIAVESVMERYGHIPLPHYIERDDTPGDRDTYQTVYASVPGAVAAPTAGLHFTDELLSELTRNGIDISYLTLHVGIGTFRPVQVEDPRKHVMHEERYSISPEAAAEIETTRKNGGRIIAVGTTVVRVLEHSFVRYGKIVPHDGRTSIMIIPPYTFGRVNGLITNFHLPCSTLLMLVSAFCGRKRILTAYQEAVTASYRFYSYGDAMFIC